MNFDHIGQNSLKEALAFKKIRTVSKTYTNNLTTADNLTTSRFKKINELYTNENSFLASNNYSFLRQHNLLNVKALGSSAKVSLDAISFNKFLELNRLQGIGTLGTQDFHKNLSFLQNTPKQGRGNALVIGSVSNQDSLLTPNTLLQWYTNLTEVINHDSDKTSLSYPARKLLNTSLYDTTLRDLNTLKQSEVLNLENINTLGNFLEPLALNTALKSPTYQSANQGILPSDQNTRQYPNLTPNTTHFNFSPHSFSYNFKGVGSYEAYLTTKLGGANKDLFLPLLTNKLYLEAPFSPIFSNQPSVDSLNYDTASTHSVKRLYLNNTVKTFDNITNSNDIFILRGKRDGAPSFLSTSY